MSDAIPLKAGAFEYTPPSYLVPLPPIDGNEEREAKPIPVITLVYATGVERDRLSARLIELGLRQKTTEQTRATMIDELFRIRERTHAHEADKGYAIAEAEANFLDDYWVREKQEIRNLETWDEAEKQRVLDIAEGAPARPPTPQPTSLFTARDRARATLLMTEIYEDSQRVRDIAAFNQDFNRRQAILMRRMHVIAVRNLEDELGPVSIDIDPKTNIATEESIARLRAVLEDEAVAELDQRIVRLYGMSEEERKNSDSLPGTPSPSSGSPEPAEDSSSDGSSTASPTTPALTVASVTTTGPSSPTSEEAAAPTSQSILTGGVGLTNR